MGSQSVASVERFFTSVLGALKRFNLDRDENDFSIYARVVSLIEFTFV